MDKILLALDGTHLNSHALDFACWLGTLTGSKITGVFLTDSAAEQRLAIAGKGNVLYGDGWVYKCSKADRKKGIIEKNISIFKATCEKNGNRCNVHNDDGDPAKEIIIESRYADILIIEAGTCFSKKFDGIPTGLVKKVLTEAECPVIIAPETFDAIDEIIFTYDGSKSSMFAIKQFCYLFPALDDKKVSLVQVVEDDPATEDERQRLSQWLSSHYSSIGYISLLGDAENELVTLLVKKKNVFVVMGAYGRNSFSQYFKHSRAECLIETVSQAMFIAHR